MIKHIFCERQQDVDSHRFASVPNVPDFDISINESKYRNIGYLEYKYNDNVSDIAQVWVLVSSLEEIKQ
jgi:hypothetical protein